MIGSKDSLNFLLATCQRTEKEKAVKHRRISESDSKVTENEAFLRAITPLDNSLSEKNDTNIKNNEAED